MESRVPLRPAPNGPGELIVLNGRQSGVRRALEVPVTFIGQSPSCALRLNVDGVDPLHCVLASGPEGVTIHDLDSARGTFVNGQRVGIAPLRDGDLLDVGPFRFRVALTAAAPAPASDVVTAATQERDAVRIQAAAIAAQQAALDEDEALLEKRRLAVQQQEARLVAHVKAQRSQLLEKSKRHQVERRAWEQDRSVALAELAEARATLERDIAALQADRERVSGREDRLADRTAKLEHQRARLHEERAEAVAEVAHARAELERFRVELERERERLRQEEGVGHARVAAQEGRLAERAASLEAFKLQMREGQAGLAVLQVQRNTQHELDSRLLQDGFDCLQADQARWRARRKREGLTLRVRWLQVVAGERKLAETRRQLLAQSEAWEAQQRVLESELHGLNNRVLHQRHKLADQERELRPVAVRSAEGKRPAGPPLDRALAARAADLDQLAGELADQRTQLVEQWERLARQRHTWQAQHDEAVGALEALAQRLAQQEEVLARRQNDADAAEDRLRQGHDVLDRLRRETAGLHAVLRVERHTWESARDQTVSEAGRLTALAQRQLEGLAELRQKWNQRRRQETEALRSGRRAVERQQQELAQARLDLATEAQQMIEEGRASPTGVTLTPSVLQALRKQRDGLKQDHAHFEQVRDELAEMGERLARTRLDLQEKQIALEYRESLLAAQLAELEQTRAQAEERRLYADRRVAVLEEETDHLARALLPEDMPAPRLLERAA